MIRAFSMEDRQCNYPDELIPLSTKIPRSMFINYTRKSCQIECRIHLAHKELDCIPWDIIRPTFEDIIHEPKICTRSQVF